MSRFLLSRLWQTLLVLLVMSFVIYGLIGLMPGDPIDLMMASNPGMTPEAAARLRAIYGLDQPLLLRYLHWLQAAVQGDLGYSRVHARPVLEVMGPALWQTTKLMLGGFTLAVLLSLVLGTLAALRPGGWLDGAVSTLALAGVSVPVFWLGEVVNLVTQSRLHDTWAFRWVPPLGYVPLLQDPAGWARALVLPWTTLAVLYAGVYGRVLRASLIQAYRQDYIRTARAKGIGEARVLLRHALRNALVAVVALFGLDIGALIGGGTLLTEVVFGLRGIGKLTYDALRNLDLPVVMAAVLYASFFVVLANAAVDGVQALLDPRRR